ncbi:MAG: HRDC domain-containing protein, partial [Burkholderiaceae bacterium]|nr:HRDC domain-containing protein [Burkholderiaceae bacterium]
VLRLPRAAAPRGRVRKERALASDRAPTRAPAVAAELDAAAQARFAALKAWRAEVAREHNLPAFLVFHDTALAAMARERPASLDELAGISGVGAKKLEAYGAEILRVLTNPE